MKRFLASALLLSVVSGFGLVGCGDTTKTETTEKVSGPSGTTERTVTDKTKTTGDGGAAGTGTAPVK